MAKKKSQGGTPPKQFRLGEDSLAKLEDLVKAFTEDSGEPETMTSVVRQLIHREHVRRFKKRQS